ncbi:hypothetical protein NQ317_015569 [Molorchus minor]|uniref:Uncharacterized protein n=1 Tax=Molorchus minor TaxID=1323400 RepID=A0ABQ9JGE8_9CUCU|nr:hypothetical protein NQ317_015569 [Molorchus minor]
MNMKSNDRLQINFGHFDDKQRLRIKIKLAVDKHLCQNNSSGINVLSTARNHFVFNGVARLHGTLERHIFWGPYPPIYNGDTQNNEF